MARDRGDGPGTIDAAEAAEGLTHPDDRQDGEEP
jgi:hypothetical protein